MPLSVGEALGPYEIVTLVGKGGMGEVYSAHDSRLKRDVAIKVSTAQFSERFECEAQANRRAESSEDRADIWYRRY